jgi:hypothetical protein
MSLKPKNLPPCIILKYLAIRLMLVIYKWASFIEAKISVENAGSGCAWHIIPVLREPLPPR